MKKRMAYIIWLLFFILIIRFAIQYTLFEYKYKNDTNYTKYALQIVEIQENTLEKFSAVAKICIENTCQDRVVVNIYENIINLKSGDIVHIIGKFSIPEVLKNIGEFNYKRYLNSKGIYGVISVNSVEKVQKSSKNLTIREKITQKVEKSINNPYSSLLTSMLYGESSGLSEEIQDNFKKIGISHIISVSGSNLAIIISILEIVLKRLRLNKYLKLVLQIFFVVMFTILSGGEYSILRACICFILSAVCDMTKIKIKSIHNMLISLYIILIINPYSIFNISLQLSYLATLGIVLYSKKIYSCFEVCLKIFKKKTIFNRIFKCLFKVILESISITISAQILSFPIQINSFNLVSITSLISNCLVSFLVTPITIIGMVGISVSFIPIVSNILFKCLIPFLWCLIVVSKKIAQITPTITIPTQLPITLFMYYALIYIFFVLNKFMISRIKIGKKYIKKNLFVKIICSIIFISLVIFSNIYIVYLDNYVYFFNVGQGSMTLIKYKGSCVVIDCGSTKKGAAYNALDSFLKSQNISKIDGMFLTHFHTDHANGVQALHENYTVKNVYYTPPNETNTIYEEIMGIKDIAFKEVYAEDKIKISDMCIEVMYPTKKIAKDKDLDLNETSTVFCVCINNKKYLFMGDSGKVAEEYLILEEVGEVYLLNVGHHGSKSSTSAEFVFEIKPDISIISSRKSLYGHPSDIVIDILKKYNSKILITEKLGGIKIKI